MLRVAERAGVGNQIGLKFNTFGGSGSLLSICVNSAKKLFRSAVAGRRHGQNDKSRILFGSVKRDLSLN